MGERADRRFELVRDALRERGIRAEPSVPTLGDDAFARRASSQNQPRLFYLPGGREGGYDRLMAAFGQGLNWTLTSAADRALIGWEPAARGYWFLAETLSSCPRLGRPWADLSAAVRLLSLEEYAVAWHLNRAIDGERFDRDECTRSWLRTRFGRGALSADVGVGQVWITRHGEDALLYGHPRRGGRSCELVPRHN